MTRRQAAASSSKGQPPSHSFIRQPASSSFHPLPWLPAPAHVCTHAACHLAPKIPSCCLASHRHRLLLFIPLVDKRSLCLPASPSIPTHASSSLPRSLPPSLQNGLAVAPLGGSTDGFIFDPRVLCRSNAASRSQKNAGSQEEERRRGRRRSRGTKRGARREERLAHACGWQLDVVYILFPLQVGRSLPPSLPPSSSV